MNIPANSPHARDIACHLHPYTNLEAHEKQGPHILEKGDGIYVIDDTGKRYIEGLAGLWCASLGFSERRLAEAAARQMEILPFYHNFASKTSPPTIDLAEKLISIAPAPMSKVFFTNSGSEANDLQIKIAWYMNNVLGRPKKKKIISRTGGYHGVTVAAASLTGLPYVQDAFDVPIANILHADQPHFYHFAEPGESQEDYASRLAGGLEKMILDEGPETVAAFIAEPVMAAGGVIPPPRTYFGKIQEVLRRHDVMLIVDEVVCGFGRTASMFGCETYGIRPDAVTVAKGLSSGYLPIGAVMISDEIYQALVEGSRKHGLFGTGFTYGGHPVPAAVALETLRIYEERDIVGHVRSIAGHFQKRLNSFAGHPLAGETRGVGLIGAIELVEDKGARKNFDPALKVGPRLVNKCLDHGLITRAMSNDSIAFCPPLIIDESGIDEMFDRFARALEDIAAEIA
ncbi:MAG: aspartate aminotransferase family protein [Rhodospirillales bacterium]